MPRMQSLQLVAVRTMATSFQGTGDETLGKLLLSTPATVARSSVTSFTPIPPYSPDPDHTVKSLIANHDTTSIILSNNSLYTVGNNKNGQLGHGSSDANSSTPQLITDCPLAEIGTKKAVIHDKFGAAIDIEGNLHTWGQGYNNTMMSGGWLGHGSDVDGILRPKMVESLVQDQCKVADVAIGLGHMTVLTTEGELLTCGCGSYGRLGNGEPNSSVSYLDVIEMVEMMSLDVAKINCGNEFTVILTKNGDLYSWGRNEKAQLGVGGGMSIDMYAMEEMPMAIEGQLEGKKIVDVSAGYEHTACVTEDGELFFWGRKLFLEPNEMGKEQNVKFTSVECGRGTVFATTEEGLLFGFGEQSNVTAMRGKHGVLGLGHTKSVNNPELVGVGGGRVVGVSVGQNHTFVEISDE